MAPPGARNGAGNGAGRLRGRVALVTGAARGIGRAIAVEFARQGASLVLTDERWGAERDALGAELGALGAAADLADGDVRDVGSHAGTVARAVARFGRLDVLVNNAGVEARAPFLDTSPALWDRVIGVNLRAPYFLSQHAARAMAAAGGGAIINVGSVRGATPKRDLSAYCVSKAGLAMLTRAMALELAEHRVRVNAVAPGAIETDLNREVLADGAYRARVEAAIPWGRVGAAADVVGAAVFLASAEADYVTGAVLTVDGGLSLGG